MYKSLKEIPHHVFTNKECTMTPSKELRNYLAYMLKNHPEDLRYIWKYTQQFKDYGGCYVITYKNWMTKLEKDLKRQETYWEGLYE